MTDDVTARAREEIAFSQAILAKGGQSVLTETLRGADGVKAWTHYPEGDVYDPESGAQWYYHAHGPGGPDGEHGHFHCFVRPEGAEGPVHHLAAVGVDAYGVPLRLFTVNQWVVGDDWLDAEGTIALLEKFDVQMPQPSYLVNRWLTAIFLAHAQPIADLIRARDARLEAHTPATDVAVREDRDLEVTSEMPFPA